MKQVDFYLIANSVSRAKFKLAGRLTNKLQSLGKHTLVVVDDDNDADLVDETLWTFSDTSFVAHERLAAVSQPISKTHIATVTETDQTILARGYDVLLTLASNVPVFSHKFTRIAEIVEADENARLAARERFRQYKTEGFELKTHNIEL